MERNGPRWSKKTKPRESDPDLSDMIRVLSMDVRVWSDEQGKLRVFWRKGRKK